MQDVTYCIDMTKTEDPNRANDLTRQADVAAVLKSHPAPWRHSSEADPEVVVDADGYYIVEMPTAELAQLVVTAVNALAAPKAERRFNCLLDGDGDKWFEVGENIWLIARDESDAESEALLNFTHGRTRGYIEQHYGPVGEVYER